MRQFIPGPGSGDFVEDLGGVKECVQNTKDYYFGVPDRMNSKEYFPLKIK